MYRFVKRSGLSSLALICVLVAPVALQASPADIQAKLDRSQELAEAGNAGEALKVGREALAMAEAELAPNDPMIGTLHLNVGAICSRIGAGTQAQYSLETALAVYQKAYGKESPKLIPVIDALVAVYTQLRLADGSAKVLELKAAIIAEEKGKKSKEYADALRAQAVAEGFRGRQNRKVRRLLRTAVRIYEDTVGEQSKEVGQTYQALSLNELGDEENGISRFTMSRKYNELAAKAYPPGSPDLIAMYQGELRFLQAGNAPETQSRIRQLEGLIAEQQKIAAENAQAARATPSPEPQAQPPVGASSEEAPK